VENVPHFNYEIQWHRGILANIGALDLLVPPRVATGRFTDTGKSETLHEKLA
jgi:hypothetical protein